MSTKSTWTFDSIPEQTGRTVIVTGANTGIGYETARALARKGARVTLACRDMKKATDAAARIQAEGISGSVQAQALDLSDLESVRAFAESFSAAQQRLDLLINNAGVMIPPKGQTKQGFELQFGTNHLGHFALTAHLLPLLLRAPGSRIVVVSSTAHHMGRMNFDDLNFEQRGYRAWAAYAQSKLANLLFARELQQRLSAAGAGTIVTAAHPGYTATDLQRNSALTSRLLNPLLAMKPADGALPTLRAATDPDAKHGEYFGPKGLFEISGPPDRARYNRRAQDNAAAARLWTTSEELTRVRFELPAAAG